MRPLAALLLLPLLASPALAVPNATAADDSLDALPPALERLEEALLESPRSAALFLYPPPVRHAVLHAATRPVLVTRLADLYGDLRSQSTALLDALPPTRRRGVARLVRYPALVADLARGVLPTNLPAPVRRDAHRFGIPHRTLLQQIHRLQRQTRDLAAEATRAEPDEVRSAFALLLRHPETLRTLDRDMRFTVLLGDAFGRHPLAVGQRTDELGLYLLRQRLETDALDESPSVEATADTQPAQRPQRPARQSMYAPYGYDTSTLEGPAEAPTTRVTYHPGYPTFYRSHPYYRPYTYSHGRYSRGYAPLYVSVGHPNLRLSYYGPRYYSYGYRPYGYRPYHRPHRHHRRY